MLNTGSVDYLFALPTTPVEVALLLTDFPDGNTEAGMGQ